MTSGQHRDSEDAELAALRAQAVEETRRAAEEEASRPTRDRMLAPADRPAPPDDGLRAGAIIVAIVVVGTIALLWIRNGTAPGDAPFGVDRTLALRVMEIEGAAPVAVGDHCSLYVHEPAGARLECDHTEIIPFSRATFDADGTVHAGGATRLELHGDRATVEGGDWTAELLDEGHRE